MTKKPKKAKPVKAWLFKPSEYKKAIEHMIFLEREMELKKLYTMGCWIGYKNRFAKNREVRGSK